MSLQPFDEMNGGSSKRAKNARRRNLCGHIDGVREINRACAVQTGCFSGDGAGCTVQSNTLRSNDGAGPNLGSQSGYREDVLPSNTGGTILGIGLVNLGNHACNGAACP